MTPPAKPVRYEAVIKVNLDDPPDRRARAIEEGIVYACELLLTVYGRTADYVAALVERAVDEADNTEAVRE